MSFGDGKSGRAVFLSVAASEYDIQHQVAHAIAPSYQGEKEAKT